METITEITDTLHWKDFKKFAKPFKNIMLLNSKKYWYLNKSKLFYSLRIGNDYITFNYWKGYYDAIWIHKIEP